MIEQLAFALVLIVAGYLIRKRIVRLRHNIRLGKEVPLTSRPADRWRQMIRVAFGQKKMFTRFTPAFFHFLIYAGFLIINLEVLEFVIDGLAGTHRIFAPFLGTAYTFALNGFEFLAVAVLLACVVFLVRRNFLPIHRLQSADLNGWPRLDANLILGIEIILMLAILTMNAADQILQARGVEHYTATGPLYFSGWLLPAWEGLSTPALVTLERAAWWFHIIGILAFAVYVTYSKHLHIFLAFPTTYFAKTQPKGHLDNMPVVTREVKSMLGLPAGEMEAAPTEGGRFGAKDINDLSRHHLLAAYSCTECGRCTSECPANQTGKKLSPRKIMMAVRDRLDEVGKSLDQGGPGLADGKSLLGDYITAEEINACTTCNACVEACPVLINPLEIIVELRRYQSMEESSAPAQWNGMFQNMETSFAPWKFPASDRFNWAKA